MENFDISDLNNKQLQTKLGRRLCELRLSMSPKLTQEGLGEKLGLNKNIILRLELGLGTIENLLLVLNLYQDLGFNANYFIARDNTRFQLKLQAIEQVEKPEWYFQVPE
jgi:transcriptional regulator with XRE-family HTH domain